MCALISETARQATLTNWRVLCAICVALTLLEAAFAQTSPAGFSAPTAQTNNERGQSGEDQSRSASLLGRIISSDGQAMTNATVSVIGVGDPRGSQRFVTTGSDGTFRIDDLAPGVYRIVPYVPGYVLANDQTPSASASNYYRPGDSVTLTMIRGGVITGMMTDADGEPAIGASVRVIRVRRSDSEEDRASQEFDFASWRSFSVTDDRGVYRIYGLAPGTYIVFGGGRDFFAYEANPYDGEAPTYFPSATRDTATEVTVRSGEEASNIDIRYRGERGYTVSGTITGAGDSPRAIIVTLMRATSGDTEATTYVYGGNNFSLDGLSDGEYLISARSASRGRNANEIASPPRPVQVRGGDVAGLQLALAPLASIRGRVQLEALTDRAPCAEEQDETLRRRIALEEIVITARRVREPGNAARFSSFATSSDVADASGAFALSNLEAARYRLRVQLPANERWYIRSVSSPTTNRTTVPGATVAARRTANAGAQPLPVVSPITTEEINLRAGERVGDVTIIVAEGAASMRGHVRPATEGMSLPARLRVYLVPVEADRANDPLRYAGSVTAGDGSFQLTRIAPGRYRIFARAVIEESNVAMRRVGDAFTDAALRSELRREAEVTNVVVELQPCGRIADYTLRYVTPPDAR